MNASIPALILALALPGPAAAQGFAGLGQDAGGFALPDPETRFAFPEDHGPHFDFRVEWWYLTANLTGSDGKDYGIQWTLFRNALAPGGRPEDQVWMGHAAVSSPEGHFQSERLARGDLGHAGVTAAPFLAFIDEWSMEGDISTGINLTAQSADFAYDLALEATGPIVPQGREGYSVKSESGLASHYYSQPFYEVAGTLTLPSGTVEVAGLGWLDREWSSQPLEPGQTGWDWIALHLETGEKLMGYRLRHRTRTPYTVGTWIRADGTATPLDPGELTMTPTELAGVAGRQVPVAWQIELPAQGLSVEVRAIYPDSWMRTLVPYWEGPVRASGTHAGMGYLELTGY